MNDEQFRQLGPEQFIDTAIPVILPSSGTVAANGAITLSTALPSVYDGGCWLYLPASALASGISGMYYAVFSSTTVGIVYTNYGDPAAGFLPSIPSGALTPAVGTGLGYTQTTGADISVMSKSIIGNYIGANGTVFGEYSFVCPSNANNKFVRTKFGGSDIRSIQMTTSPAYRDNFKFKNRGRAGGQVVFPGYNSTTPFGAVTSIIPTIFSIDTSVDQLFAIALRLAAATDYAILGYVEIYVNRMN